LEHLTKDEFLEWFPMFGDAPDSAIDSLLDLAQVELGRCIWGRRLKWGQALFVAHWLALRKSLFGGWDEESPDAALWLQGVLQSTVTSFSAGSVSWSKDSAMVKEQAKNPFLRTNFGQEFMALRDQLATGLVMVT